MTCPQCQKPFTPTVDQRNASPDKAGPFCDKVCAGSYSAGIRDGNKAIGRNNIKKTYYHVEK